MSSSIIYQDFILIILISSCLYFLYKLKYPDINKEKFTITDKIKKVINDIYY